MDHAVIVSDVHLCEAIPGEGLWMRYRHKRYFPDEEFAQFFSSISREIQGGNLEVIFNGDIFDFDAPSFFDQRVHFNDSFQDETSASQKMSRILDDHVSFVNALSELLQAGHTLVFISGNHDSQMIFPSVQAALTSRLMAVLCATGVSVSGATERLQTQLVFQPWFYRTQTGIHVEHGNQYDGFCSFHDPANPFVPQTSEIYPTMGSLTFRHLVSRLGFFNPYVDEMFMLSFPRYVIHWFRHYLFTRRFIIVIWIKGTINIFSTICSLRWKSMTRRWRECFPQSTDVHTELFTPPSDTRLFSVIRELWLDRVLFVVVSAVLSWFVASVFGWRAAGLVAAVLIISFFTYEVLMPKPVLADIYQHMATRARIIAQLHRARAVVFGHTHIPFGLQEQGIFIGNSGTWSSSFLDSACTKSVMQGRPVIWLRGEKHDSILQGGLYRWHKNQLQPWLQENPSTLAS